MIDVTPLVRQRRAVLVAWFALVVLALPGLQRLDVDSSADRFVVDEPEASVLALDARRHFGSGLGVRMLVEGDALWTPASLAWLSTVERDAARLRGVRGVVGISRHAWRFEVWPPDDSTSLAETLRADPFDRGAGFIDASARSVTSWIGLADLPLADRRATLDALDALIATAPEGLEVRLLGLPTIGRALDLGLLDSVRRVLPLAFLASLLVLLVAFGRGTDLMTPLVGVGSVMVVVFGSLGHVDATFDIVSIVLAPILYVVVLAMVVHVLSALRQAEQRAGDPPDGTRGAIVETWTRKAAPVLWTGLTTAVGFGSLATSTLLPIRQLGLWAAYGLLVGTVFTLFVLPAWVATTRPTRRATSTRFETTSRRLGGRLAELAIAYRRSVVWTLIVLTVAATFGVGRLRTDNDLRQIFRSDAPIHTDLAALEAHGLGAVSVDLILRPVEGGEARFDSADAFDRLANLAEALRADRDVLGVVGYPDLVASVERITDGDTGATIASTAALDALSRRFVARSGERARLMLSLPWLDPTGLRSTFERLDVILDRELVGSGLEAGWTGSFYRVFDVQEQLTATLLRSTLVTIAVIAVLFVVLLGPELAARALVPNLLPGWIMLGALGWLEIAIDPTLVLHVSIILGLAVDDTLHTLSRFVSSRSKSSDQAVLDAIEHTAPAHVATSGLLIAGFGLWVASAIVPAARFGVVSAVAIGLVLIADLVVAPALFAGATSAARARARRRFEPS